MLLFDVNVLVYAFRQDVPESDRYAAWLEGTINSEAAFGLSSLVLSGFLRIVTHPRILSPPATIEEAFAFTETIRSQAQCVTVSPGPRHWQIFTHLCKEAGARGNLIPDAYLAALAIESGSEWITTDRDFARFPGLRWRHPLSSEEDDVRLSVLPRPKTHR